MTGSRSPVLAFLRILCWFIWIFFFMIFKASARCSMMATNRPIEALQPCCELSSHSIPNRSNNHMSLWNFFLFVFNEELAVLLFPAFLYKTPAGKPPVASLAYNFRKVGHIVIVFSWFVHYEKSVSIIVVAKTKKIIINSCIFFMP